MNMFVANLYTEELMADDDQPQITHFDPEAEAQAQGRIDAPLFDERPVEERLADHEGHVISLMQEMQREFRAMCQERAALEERRKELDKIVPSLAQLVTHVDTLSGFIQTLMDERAEQHEGLLKTIPTQLRPSVSGQPSPEQVDDVWEQGSGPQILGMEIDPRERKPNPRTRPAEQGPD